MQWKVGHDLSGGGGYCGWGSDGGRSSDGTAKAKEHNEEHVMMPPADGKAQPLFLDERRQSTPQQGDNTSMLAAVALVAAVELIIGQGNVLHVNVIL